MKKKKLKPTAMCINPSLSPSYVYKKFQCRCARCITWKKEAASRTNNKELAKKRSKEWRLNNLERSRNSVKNYQLNNPDKVFSFQLKKYNITLEQFIQLETIQNFCCAICKQKCNIRKRLSIDHNHNNKKVRGLLCSHCNLGLGHFNDNILILENAIKYLKENGDVYK